MEYTIIITVYNKEKYIERCLKSIINQTNKNYKIMVVNDGSTDKSEEIITKYKKDIIYYYKENSGVADTRNFAINKVDTKYFLFVDADDYIENNLIETISKYKDYDLLSFNALNVDSNLNLIRNIIKPEFEGEGRNFFVKLVDYKGLFTVPWGYVYNTKWFKKNKFKYPKNKIIEDYYLTPYIIIEAKKVKSINYYGYYYVDTIDSITNSKKIEMMNTYLEYYDIMSSNLNYDNQLNKKFKSFLAGTLIWYGTQLTGEYKKKYIKVLKKKKIIQELERPFFRKQVLCLLYYINLYYPLRRIIKNGK